MAGRKLSYFKDFFIFNYFNFDNVRFEVGKKICLSISGHHPETWQVNLSAYLVVNLKQKIKLFSFGSHPGP